MSTDTERAPFETPAERTAPRTNLDAQRPQDFMTVRRLFIEGIGVAAVLLATVVIYVFFIVYPFEPKPRNLFLIFERGNTAIWPMQLICYAGAAAMVGLALWQGVERASSSACSPQ